MVAELGTRLGLVDYAKMHYNLLGNGGIWFAGLHARYLNHFDITASIRKSSFADKVPGWLAEAQELLHKMPEKRRNQI